MLSRRSIKRMLFLAGIPLGIYLAVAVVLYVCQRSLLYFPSHHPSTGELTPWKLGDRTIGFCREAPQARTVWLMMHGNGGQAADRSYVLPHLSADDSLYVLEYPGYGQRAGRPSRESLNAAAVEAYHHLRAQFPRTPVCVLGESLGSGPACMLAGEETAPEKIVLVVPFDRLTSVAAKHYFHLFPARLLVCDAWDNIAALDGYTGPVEIFGARSDTIIPLAHAETLAASVSGARFTAISGGHNDWSLSPLVQIRH